MPTDPMPLPALEDTGATRLAQAIASAVHAAGGRTFFVGGCVRDRILGIPVCDLDLEVYGIAPDALPDLLARAGKVDEVGRDFGILKVTKDGASVDVALPRTERKHGKGHRGFAVDADPALDPIVAASRRDLTINAVMEDVLTRELLDPWGGVADAQAGLLRHVSSAFSEDPLRVLRVVQFAARFEFRVADETLALCSTIDLSELAAERIASEFEKWLGKAARPSRGLFAFIASGAFRVAPEIGFTHADATAPDNVRLAAELGARLDRAATAKPGLPDPNPFLLAVLLSNNVDSIADPAQEARIAARLAVLAIGLARQSLALRTLKTWRRVRGCRLDAMPSAPEVRRLALALPIAIVRRLLEVDGEAAVASELERRAEALGVGSAPPEPWVLGRDLVALGAKPGKELGAMLDALFEHQLDDRLQDRDAALALAKRWIESGRRDPP